MKIKIIIGIGIVLFCFGCSEKQKGLVYFNDFEGIKGWAQAYLNKEPHRSGQYSNKLDSTSCYSMTFKLRFKDIADRPVKKAKISFWALMIDPASPSKFIVDIYTPDKTKIFYIAKDIPDYVKKAKKWVKVNLDYTFVKGDVTLPDNIISVYAWNQSKNDIYIDDLRIEFVVN
jgi:hypothetical protein